MQYIAGVDFVCSVRYCEHMDVRTFGERLKAIREGKIVRQGPKISLRELAKRTGIGFSTISQWESGDRWRDKQPPGDDLARLADGLGVTVAQLQGREEGEPEVIVTIDEHTRRMAEIGEQVVRLARAYDPPPTEVAFEVATSGFRELPVEDYVPASHGAPDATQLRDTIRIPEELLEGCQEPHVFYVAGDCLKPEGIRRGNHLIVDGARRNPKDGDVVVARIDSELTMKLYFRLTDRVELRPAAEGYETLVAIDGRNQLEIIGVAHAVYSTGKLSR